MAKGPQIPAKAVKAAIAKSIADKNRDVFSQPLVDALHLAPRKKDLQELRKNPELWGRHIRTLSSLNGYIEKTVHETRHYDIAQLAEILLARYGEDKAREMLRLHNLPSSLIPESQPEQRQGTIIEHDSEPAETSNVH